MKDGRIGLSCRGLSKRYRSNPGEVTALENVTFDVAPGEFVCVVGPSGCGKTSLLKVIAGLTDPSGGAFEISGPTHGPRPALVFQDHGLFPWMTVRDNVGFALDMQGVPEPMRSEQVLDVIERFGLGSFVRAYPHQLSGGLRQRVGIARAFVSGAPILLMDEPFGLLDAQTRWVLREELLRIWSGDKKVVLYVTHDIEEALLLGDRVLVMSGRPGRILEDVVVPLPRPRDPQRDENTLREMTWRIWKHLEQEVRDGMTVRG